MTCWDGTKNFFLFCKGRMPAAPSVASNRIQQFSSLNLIQSKFHWSPTQNMLLEYSEISINVHGSNYSSTFWISNQCIWWSRGFTTSLCKFSPPHLSRNKFNKVLPLLRLHKVYYTYVSPKQHPKPQLCFGHKALFGSQNFGGIHEEFLRNFGQRIFQKFLMANPLSPQFHQGFLQFSCILHNQSISFHSHPYGTHHPSAKAQA